MTRFDVIVVGGSVAGAATAIACGQRGLTTLLLEAQTKQRDIPGETLHPGIEPLFRALGVAERVNACGFTRHAGYLVTSGGKVCRNAYGSDAHGVWLGYQAERGKLHAILLEQADASGVEVLRGERALRPLFEGSKVAGVVSNSGAYRSSFVADTSGGAHWLMRQLRFPILRVSPRLIAHFGWIAGEEQGHGADPLPEFNMRDAAWHWRAPIRGDKHAWVHLDLDASRRGAELTAHSRVKGSALDVTWRIARPCAGPGYFLAGDAAWVLDPASSHGVLFAIMSAMAAADAIYKVLQSPAEDRRIQAGYISWIEDWFCRDAAALISLYSGMDSRPGWLASASEAMRYIAMSPSDRALSKSAS
jgi:flavin-dependent dehydrogenase